MRWKENRIVPMIYVALNFGLWLFWRGGSTVFKKYPLTKLIMEKPIQMFLFGFLGFCVCWLIHTVSERRLWVKLAVTVAIGILFLAVHKIYIAPLQYKALISFRYRYLGLFYLLGALLFCFYVLLDEKLVTEVTISLKPLSTYRPQLMGVAMLCVLIYHTISMKVTYGSGVVSTIVSSGYFGVDIFMLLSGLGISYALSKNEGLLRFYGKRLLRIYPYYVPMVALYTIVCMLTTTDCTPDMIFWNCTGIGYWTMTDPYLFNWYIPAILVFYLLAPLVYRVLRNERFRAVGFALVITAWVAVSFILKDGLKYDRAVALSRFPIFVLGMLIGFLIMEGKSITKKEYLTCYPMLLFLVTLYLFKEKCDVPMISWHWIFGALFIPVLCIILGRLFARINSRNLVMRFLGWMGKNNLMIFLVNIMFCRFTVMFVRPRIPDKTVYSVFAYFTIAADLMVVFLYSLLENRIKKAVAAKKCK